MMTSLAIANAALLVLIQSTEVPAVNSIETYLVRWWGTEGSEMGRPIYRVAHLDNGALEIRYVIVPGRRLGDFTMPYWGIKSGVSILNRPAELGHHVVGRYRTGEEAQEVNFIPRSGVELAQLGDADVFKIRSRSLTSPEDVTIEDPTDYEETNPLMMECAFVVAASDHSVE